MNQAALPVDAARTYRVTLPEFEQLEKRLARLNRRKCAGELALVGVEPYRFKVPAGDSYVWAEGRQFQVSGDVPRMGGWTFLATIEHTPAGNVIAKAPAGRDVDLTAYREQAQRCDHCNTNRRRKETYLVQHSDGRIWRVGKNCLADFLRTDDAAAIVAQLAWLNQLNAATEPGDWGAYPGEFGLPVERYVACAVKLTRKHGFKPSSFDNSTRSEARFACGPRPRPDRDGSDRLGIAWLALQPDESDHEKARECIRWAAESTDSSDFAHTLRVAVASECATRRTEGVLAALPKCADAALARATEQAREAEQAARQWAPGYAGEIGERLRDLPVEVKRARWVDSDFGGSTMIVMRSEAGHQLVWWASGDRDVEPGDRLLLTGTVKKHSEYNGASQTTVTRCKLVDQPESTEKLMAQA